MTMKRNTISFFTIIMFLTGLAFISETEAGRRDDGKKRYSKNQKKNPNKTVLIEKSRNGPKKTTVKKLGNKRKIVKKTTVTRYRGGQKVLKKTTVRTRQPVRKVIAISAGNHYRNVVRAPVRYRPIKVHGKKYYHRHGRFYRWTTNGYVAMGALIGAIILDLPIGYTSIYIGGHRYYHCDGIYFRRHNHGYRVVRPPIGSRLSVLPYNSEIVRLNDGTYYNYNGTYYRQVGTQYEICEAPKMVIANSVQKPNIIEKNYHTIMVNNSNGSQTPVDLEQIGENQWKGPKGEIYRGWPSQEQLRQVYGF